ncbi:hypothetical protein GCM10009535_05230 [Streptomyces thermocarboxydovorans]|uniref:Uncharacterized protein n=1 Tax=Streptomyces thermocarboxydovorans TaxID=59298 RepID=A0ABN1H839_9ACTN
MTGTATGDCPGPAELMREPGAGKWPAAGLIAHGYAGAVQLRVVCMMAMQDAVFAIDL